MTIATLGAIADVLEVIVVSEGWEVAVGVVPLDVLVAFVSFAGSVKLAF